ncbi:polysaccharide deacetylase family protein [Nocardia puris]|uniref:Peptidoglycan/xylan/chitin deacetylase (PgdA/CDA1 family) n=1 Tax=Nocardia puris TaxID=208602 RepID=A0A366DM70_9NOCA|nr:polysaccharide deacetylase family protein [Nocardia puris]MBF6211246.1 polysaccharide deacetylase family protein [Nocardia puris]MBF6364965.1 polysaccharide deacetylase family protein [Nocardia puris]MBF6458751.1 polysaccharide deacetylase family protein [Nocardia puris]RBO90599.1 peptidoglycan/xylan/chitin deacetylase (PgdA/CDA1 family) [Nocardia puris]
MRKSLIGGAIALVVLILLAVGTYHLMNSRTYQLAGRLVDRVDTSDKVVALTFDDGPSERTGEMLEVLAAADIPATFYLNGRDLAAHPEAGRAIAEAGHEIGNHTYNHRRMVFVSGDTVRDEIDRTDEEIAKTGYTGPITFRPPYGKKLWALPRYLSENDRTTVMWDIEPDSGKRASADEIVTETVESVRPGSIILLHVMGSAPQNRDSVAAVPRIITELRSAGYSFVTISDLLRR